ncbi:hypothetical protein MGG_17434 [Pyricularia oryzae 70-15]|uniref:Uncharacterized protein n=4 Tax=Pyricularia oryzae TaxID=318829 RepID=G4NBI2_PYRO7|nr:uncharacterized protein MGG_17434 [Pyricularia oryzae 70-15]ELQ38875.1 hypothetical protein OOU_Y34scaffold00522g30 [Pyricularia oryzae Y34]KAI7919159.1 hypothetical protein M0657_007257 [Pyricularia oryzae]EHA48939.1 hypothetical protein MGG_17434 [Pyricularia oryzae 70-15]KAI7922311.1 hypothetical protein M9X92_004894 [Pyricularia oryzae]QBZ62765.1 hypothetical protein PoMZ_11652 [Pyricularia oryzae]
MGKENMGQSSSAHTGEDQESGSVEAMRVIPSLGQQGVSASRTTVRNKNQAEVQHAWWSPRSHHILLCFAGRGSWPGV